MPAPKSTSKPAPKPATKRKAPPRKRQVTAAPREPRPIWQQRLAHQAVAQAFTPPPTATLPTPPAEAIEPDGAITEPVVAADDDEATPAAPTPPNPHLVQADLLLQQLIAQGAEPHPRMVQTEAAWWALSQLVQRGTLAEEDATALLHEGMAHVLADLLQYVEEQRATSPSGDPRGASSGASSGAPRPPSPQRRLAHALDTVAPTSAGRPGERRTPGGLILP